MVIEAQHPLVQDGRVYFRDDLCCELRSLSPVYDSTGKLISEISSELVPEKKYTDQVKQVLKDLNLECSHCLKFDRILGFGSSFNGFRNKRSDVDVVVELKNDGIDEQLITCKRNMERSYMFKLKDFIRGAQVPIVTVEHIKTGLPCDISFSVPSISRVDVNWNTHLLKTYSDNYPAVTHAFRLLKHILNFTTFGSVRTGGLSTYGHIVLFLYYVTHHFTPKVPLIHVATLQPDSTAVKPALSGPEIFIGYLRFVACKLDSSIQYVDIRNPESMRRNPGLLGQLCIQDPYISKNLGKYMKGQQLFNFKVFCYRLLHYFYESRPSKLSQIDSWCKNYQHYCVDMAIPQIHPQCEPLYRVKPKNSKRSKMMPPKKTPMKMSELHALTIEPTNNGAKSTTYSTVNKLLCKRQDTEAVDVSWSDVLGEALKDISKTIDTTSPKLQCLVVFSKERDVERAELLLQMMPAAVDLVVASCLTKRDGAQLYLTNYLNTIPKDRDVSSVRRIYVYQPNLQVPLSLWRTMRDVVPGQLYFMLEPAEDSLSTSKQVDKLVPLYCTVAVDSRYLYTLHLSELKQELLLTSKTFSSLPDSLEIHEIGCR